mmetsp:Transcript_22629/g.76017  ORF Transcript_22629/g.76017 Transcript_22629/m.76017 type:complete len:274 (-) Transcript_22629:58-879(-)
MQRLRGAHRSTDSGHKAGPAGTSSGPMQVRPPQLMTLASFTSLSTSSSTLPTLMPAWRLGGSATCNTSSLGSSPTPRSSGESFSIFFFLAFMMLGSVAYRGSLRRRSVVTTAGSFTPMVSRPPSTSRTTSASAAPSLIRSSEANVAWGQPSMVDSIWPVWLKSPSMACLPRITKSGDSRSQIALKSLATWSGMSPSESCVTCTPRSAPMASATRMVSCACCGPMETATTSLAIPFSLSRTLSSTAISSKGFMDILTPLVSTPILSGRTRTLTA